VSDSGDRLYARLAPVAVYDASNGNVVRALADVLAAPQDLISQVARGDETFEPWARATSPSQAPDVLLPWLAQFAGVELLPSDTVAQQRARIGAAAGFYRGTTRAMREAVELTLTGEKFVSIVPRVGGDMWQMTVRVRASECPDLGVSERAALSQKPAGVILTFTASDVPAIDEGTLTIDTGTDDIDDATVEDVT
jgi:hypothetical protein